MRKNKKRILVVLFAVILLYNIVFLTLPTLKSTTFWLSYVFGLVSIIFNVFLVQLAWGIAKTTKSKFMGVPILIVGKRYLYLQMTSSGVFLLISVIAKYYPTNSFSDIPFFVPLIINSVLFTVCILSVIFIDSSRDKIDRVDKIVNKKTLYLNSLEVEIDILYSSTLDKNIKNILFQIKNKIKFSDPMSAPELSHLEDLITIKISKLEQAISSNDIEEVKILGNKILNLIEERNLKTKLLKQAL